MKKEKPMPDAEFADIKKEAMAPELSKDFIQLGTKELQVRILWYGGEEMIVDAITEGIEKAKEINKETPVLDMVKLAKKEIFKVLPRIMTVIFEDQGVTPEWLNSRESRVSSVQMWDALQAQIEKNGLADRLGKLLTIEGLGGLAKAMKSFV